MKENRLLQSRLFPKQKIALLLFGIILCFVLLEASLRLGGFAISSLQEHRNNLRIRQKNVYRIMCLGESTTLGQYPPFLETILNQRNIGIRFSVIEKGLIGVNTSVILTYLESNLDRCNPDMVITMMGINDEKGERMPYEAITNSKTVLFFKSFRIYKLTRLLWLHILTKAKEAGFYKSSADKQYPKEIQTYLLRGGLEEAYAESISMEDSLKKAIELDPKSDQAYIELGRLYRHQGKLYLAEDAFKKAIEINPENYKAYINLGNIRGDLGVNSVFDTEDLFKKAVELNPNGNDAYINLGYFYAKHCDFSKAEEAFKKAIELNLQDDAARLELGLVYRNQGKTSQAEDAFKKTIEINPKNDRVYFELGWLYLGQGKFSQAEDAFKKTIEINPDDDRAYAAILLLYKEMGKPELAKEYAQKTDRLRLGYYNPVTVDNYRKLKEILVKRGIRLVCVQYPMRNVEPLKKIFEKDESIIFVDNESVFKEALKKASYKEYFSDMFAGDFGHCTEKGNRLLAKNIADVILKEVFNKRIQEAF